MDFTRFSDPAVYEVIDRVKEILQDLGRWQPEVSAAASPDSKGVWAMAEGDRVRLGLADFP